VVDKHDSTYALALEETRKAMVKSMQTPSIASNLMWIYWHHDPDPHIQRCRIRAQGPLDAVMLNEIECDVTTPSGEKRVGKNVYKWFPGNEESDIKTTWRGMVTSYSKLQKLAGQGHQADVFHVVFADIGECDMNEESLRRLLCSSGTVDGARGLIDRVPWDLATCLYAVTDTKQYQGLGMECNAAPTVCACLFGRDCTLKGEGTI